MIQLYIGKMNFDTQKAQRFLKERRVPFQVMDLKKHRLGERELDLFIRAVGGVKKLVDRADPKVSEHPVAFFSTDSLIRDELLAHPAFLVSPIVRNGQRVCVGYDKDALEALVKETPK